MMRQRTRALLDKMERCLDDRARHEVMVLWKTITVGLAICTKCKGSASV